MNELQTGSTTDRQSGTAAILQHQQYQRIVRWSGLLTVLMALLIVVIKLYAALQTNAASVLASLMDATLDVAVSLLNFFVLRYALKPADDDHRFGHGKAEAVMALFQAAFLTGFALLLCYEGFNRFWSPEPVGAVDTGIWALLVCTGLTLLLVLVQRTVVARTGSLAVKADAAHYSSDLLMNGAVILALFLVQSSLLWADAAISLGIAGFLLWSAFGLLREALSHLLDQELPEAERVALLAQVTKLPGVLGVTEFRSRRAGPRVFLQLRLQLPADWSLRQAHDVTDLAEQMLAGRYPAAEVIIHADPLSPSDAPSAAESLVSTTASVVKN